MTAAPIDIPLDDRGAPDVQLLVRKLGEAAAKARGEAYDPAHNPAHAGYPRITPAIWRRWTRRWRNTSELAAPGSRRRHQATRGPDDACLRPSLRASVYQTTVDTNSSTTRSVPAVVAPTEATAAIQSSTGALMIYRRHNKPALGPVGDSLDPEPPVRGSAVRRQL